MFTLKPPIFPSNLTAQLLKYEKEKLKLLVQESLQWLSPLPSSPNSA